VASIAAMDILIVPTIDFKVRVRRGPRMQPLIALGRSEWRGYAAAFCCCCIFQFQGCAYHLSHPDIFVMESAEEWDCCE
jgi:hypothetical protein